MYIRFKGKGWIAPLAIAASFLVFRLLLDAFSRESEGKMHDHINGIVLAVSGAVTLLVAMTADRKNGIEVLSIRAWTSELFVSEHISFSLPMRLVGMVLFAASFLF